jgi:ABC-type molybdate transport system substrate-binding protein
MAHKPASGGSAMSFATNLHHQDLQLTTVFATGIGTGTKEQAAAKEFIKFLTSSAAAAVIKATGMEPEGP